MTSFLVSCPDCGHRFPVERDTMRAVEGCRACGAKGAHFCPGNPNVRNVSIFSPEKLERAGRLSQDPEPAA